MPLEEVWELIADAAEQVKYQSALEISQSRAPRAVNQVEVTDMQEMKEMMQKMLVQGSAQQVAPQQAVPCEYCFSLGHSSDQCGGAPAEPAAEINAVGGWNNNRGPPAQGQRQFGLSANNFSWKEGGMRTAPAPAPAQVAPRQQGQQATYNPPHRRVESGQQRSLEEVLGQMANSLKRMEEKYDNKFALHDKRFETIETHLSQIATTVSELKQSNGILPSQVVVNPRDRVSVVTLISEMDESRQGAAPASSAPRQDQADNVITLKWKDPGAFSIPCLIGTRLVRRCMLDLGAAINVLPFALYKILGLGPLQPTQRRIQLADGRCKAPVGVVENVPVQCGELVIPADFVVIEMEGTKEMGDDDLILGRNFMLTARTQIDVWKGLVTMRGGGKARFEMDLSGKMKYFAEEVHMPMHLYRIKTEPEESEAAPGYSAPAQAYSAPVRKFPMPAPDQQTPNPHGFELRRREPHPRDPRDIGMRRRMPHVPSTSGVIPKTPAPPEEPAPRQYRRTARIQATKRPRIEK